MLFINTCSGKNYEEIKNNANFGQIDKNNKDYKDKVINMIESLKNEDPMYYSITKEKKNELCYKKDLKTYYIHEVNYVNTIYKDFTQNKIFSKSSDIDISKKEKYKFTESFIYKHKRALGLFSGGVLGGVSIVGLMIPGLNVLEIGLLGSFIGGVTIGGGTGFFILKHGMKSTLAKIKAGEISSIKKFEDK